MSRIKSSRASARDRILSAASKLFYKEGVNKVGIDRIIAESGVAKMSLYHHFKSKDALIAVYLEQFDETYNSWFHETVEQLATEPGDRLLAIFDVLHNWFQDEQYRGCTFINTIIELANPDHPGHHIAVTHKQSTVDYIQTLVTEAGAKYPDHLAQQLALLIEGAIVGAMMGHGSDAAIRAKDAAAILLEASIPVSKA